MGGFDGPSVRLASRFSAVKIRNWERFQHYKNRNPPWIKLHKRLLDNPDWALLPDHASRLLVELWLLGSENDGELPDLDRIAFRVRRPKRSVGASLKVLQDKGFVSRASSVLDQCLGDAVPETEAETEKRQRQRESTQEVFDYWVLRRREALNLNGGPQPVLNAKRSKSIMARIGEGYDVPTLKRAVDGCMASDFHLKGGHLDIELICRDAGKVDGFLLRTPDEPEGSAELGSARPLASGGFYVGN